MKKLIPLMLVVALGFCAAEGCKQKAEGVKTETTTTGQGWPAQQSTDGFAPAPGFRAN